MTPPIFDPSQITISPDEGTPAFDINNITPVDDGTQRSLIARSSDVLARAATMGLANPLNAAGIAATRWLLGDKAPEQGWSDLYHQELAREQGEQGQFATEHPNIDLASEALGAVGGAGPALAKNTSLIGAKLLNPAKSGVGKVVQGAAMGTGMGAASGFGNTPASEDALKGAERGAEVGGVLGGTLPILVASVGSGLSWLSNLLPGGTERQATSIITNKLSQDAAASSRDILSELPATLDQAAAMGKPVAVGDLGGTNIRKLGFSAISQPGQGAETGADFLVNRDLGMPQPGADRFSLFQRRGGAADRVTQDLNDAFGSDNARITLNTILKDRKTAAAPLYDAFRASPPTPLDQIQPFMESPTFKQAVQKANKSVLDEGGKPLTDYFMFDADGNVSNVKNGAIPPDVLDRVKQGIDDVWLKAKNPMSGDASDARTANMLRTRFLNFMDQKYSDTYPAARAAFSGPSQSANALTAGQRVMKADSPEQLQDVINNLRPEDVPLFKLGARQALVDTVSKTADGGNEVAKMFGTGWKRGLVSHLFDNPQQMQDFDNRMAMELRMLSTKNAQLGNSATAERLASNAHKEQGTAPELIAGALASGEGKAGMAMAAMNAIKGAIGADPMANPEVRAAVARKLYSSNPQANSRLAEDLLNRIRGNVSKGIAPSSSRIGIRIAAPAAAGAYMGSHPNQLLPNWGVGPNAMQ